MGLILDSSVLIAAERNGHNARSALAEIALRSKSEKISISALTLMEMAHGVAQAITPARKLIRREFLRDLAAVLPIYGVTASIALRAGELDASWLRPESASQSRTC